MTTINTMRKRAARAGLRLTKIRQGSRHFAEYGPFVLSDLVTTGIVACALQDLGDVERVLEANY